MRLAAVYIKDHFLFHKPQTINFGGKNIYTFETDINKPDEIEITKTINPDFIDGFWGDNISLVSAIVGENGAGKTSLLKVINSILNNNIKDKNQTIKYVLIFENLVDKKILCLSNMSITHQDIEIITNKIIIETLFYSPIIDYDLKEIRSSISMVNYFDANLSVFYLKNIQRHLFFLNKKELIEELKNSYSNFPFYTKLEVKTNQLYKSDFEKHYIQTNLGNQLIDVKNSLISLTENQSYTFSNKEEVKNFFDKRKGIQDKLKKIWDLYKDYSKIETQKLHDGKDFTKNFEVNILSYLVIKDIVAINGDNGSYDFETILKAKEFKDKLSYFLNKFIIQTSKQVYDLLISEFTEIKIENIVTILNKIEKVYSFTDTDKYKKKEIITYDLVLFRDIFDFYKLLISLQKKEYSNTIEGGFEIDIQEADEKEVSEFIRLYEELQIKLSKGIDFKSSDILDIKSNKKLSSGEKALLDMYASIYEYLKRFGDHQYSENMILLLDEADLGHHPDWKKKFINAIVKTLPELFKVKGDIIKNLQIIFTTHDPLTLSDIPNSNVVYLKKDGDKTSVLKGKERPQKSFGANITDLLADSFFINVGLIGDFAKNKIQEVIDWLNNENRDNTKKEDYKKTIEMIGETFLKNKMLNMYCFIFKDEINKIERKKELENIIQKSKEELTKL